MAEDTITDPTRIGQLLASELTGLETGVLGDVAVVDADQSATPSPDGTVAYAIAVGERTVGRVRLYPDVAVVELDAATIPDATRAPGDAIDIEREDGTLRLSVQTGAAVKRAVDVLRDALGNRDG